MICRSFPQAVVVSFAVALTAAAGMGCSKPSGGSAESQADAPPPAPTFDGWTVKTDVVEPRARIGDIEARLEGRIKALRNVVYDVNGKKVQVNVLVPQSSADADKIYRKLTSMKPAWACVRKGDVLYELVGENDVTSDMQKASAKLSGT